MSSSASIPHNLLQEYFRRKCEKSPSLSVRGLAGRLGVSPSYISRVLQGKKPLAPRLLPAMAENLEMDPLAVRKMQLALVREKLPADFELPLADEKNQIFQEADFPSYELLDSWYQIALLDLISVKDFKTSAVWIARKLRITPAEAKAAWNKLRALKVVKKNEAGRWVKQAQYLHFPTQRTDPRVRNFHLQHLEIAKIELTVRTMPQDFERRLIAGSSMAVNPAKLPKAKELLLRTMQEITALLTEGECTEVYHLNIALLPLTQKQ